MGSVVRLCSQAAGKDRLMTYRIRIEPATRDEDETILIQDDLGALRAMTNVREEAVAWLIDQGCWPREADLLHDYEHDTVYQITADCVPDRTDLTN